jgi:hypothetical protein
MRHLAWLFLVLGSCSLCAAQDEEKAKSGPKEGTFVPAPFECYNVNGEAKGRMHCLVCEFALYPSVLVFVKEPAAGKDKSLNDLITQLDATAQEFRDRQFSVGAVFLSPDARDSTNSVENQSAKILEEAAAREKLVKRLEERVENLKLKQVVVASYLPPGPKGYDFDPKAEITVLFYERLKIIKNWSYQADKMQADDVAQIVTRIRA